MKIKIKKIVDNLGVGMRTLKTALAVFICLGIALISGYQNPLYACIATVVCMQVTTEKTWDYGKARLVGTGIGGFVGIFFVWIISGIPAPLDQLNLIFIPIGIIIGMMICNTISMKDACAICGVTVMAVMFNHPQTDRYLYALMRTLETGVGAVVAILINRFINFGRKQNKKSDADEAE